MSSCICTFCSSLFHPHPCTRVEEHEVCRVQAKASEQATARRIEKKDASDFYQGEHVQLHVLLEQWRGQLELRSAVKQEESDRIRVPVDSLVPSDPLIL